MQPDRGDPQADLTPNERRLALAAASVFDVDVQRQVQTALRHRLWRITLGYFGALLVAAICVWQIGLNATGKVRRVDARGRGALAAASTGSCIRVQRLRTQLNKFQGIVYLFIIEARDARLAEYHVTRLAVSRQAANDYEAIAESILWIPPTDCHTAVGNPLHYRPPEPIPYGQALRLRLIQPPPSLKPRHPVH